jgi:hypothetical protein
MDNPSHLQVSSPLPELDYSKPPIGSDRRSFMMRSAMAAAIVALGGQVNPLWAKTPAGKPLGDNDVDPNLQVIKNTKGPVMTLVDEFYKVGPGPSSSHTIGPMRITYDFYQRASKLPADQLAQATAMRVRPGRGMAPSAPRSPVSRGLSLRPSIQQSSTTLRLILTRRSRSSLAQRQSTSA